jgi:glycosidase
MKAFNMNYGWHFHHVLNELAQGKVGAEAVFEYMEEQKVQYDKDDIRMYFTTNHDENSWNGTVFERMGDQHKNAFIVCATLPGMPLIYSGQEVGLNHRLSFFGKDQIDWSNTELIPFYTALLKLKHDNPALWNGNYGGSFEPVDFLGDQEGLLAYKRVNGDKEVLVVLNLTDEEIELNGEDMENLDEYQMLDLGWDQAYGGGHMLLGGAEGLVLYR